MGDGGGELETAPMVVGGGRTQLAGDRRATVVDFALNPVSVNERGQMAIRVALADGRQFILRADPAA